MTGYNVPEVVAAIQEQAGKMLHSSTLYLIENQIELAEKIAGLSGIPNAKVFFTNSGTEANDTALMIATQYRKSNQVLAIRGSYHGKSHSTVAITGQRNWSATANYPFNVTYVQGPYKLRSPFGQLSDDEFITGLHCRPQEPSRDRDCRRRRLHDRRADPGSRWVRHASGRVLRLVQRSARRKRGSSSSPTKSRPDGEGPASTSGAIRPTGSFPT